MKRRLAGRAALAAGLLLGSCADEPAETRLTFDEERATFVAAPVSGDGNSSEAFVVFVGEPDFVPGTCKPQDEQPPLLGRVVRDGPALLFEPRAPWRSDLSYTACFDPAEGAGGAPQLARLEPSSTLEGAAPRVVSVWPAAGAVPANLLRLYVTFDQPMQQRDLDRGVQLLESGRPIRDALVAIPEGLWDDDSRRLTLFLHPGRIKRGVGPREAQGPALEEGSAVTLHLAGLRSAAGAVLAEYEVVYRVVADDRSSPNPQEWRTTAPTGENEPLLLEFDERLDVALAQRLLTVRRDGDPIPGKTQVDGRRWSFLPEAPWQPGNYEVVVDPRIEDLAGNRPGRLFDRRLTTGHAPEEAATRLPFEVR